MLLRTGLVLSLLALPCVAHAQRRVSVAPAGNAAAAVPATPPAHGATPAQDALANGLRLLVAHDYDGATAAFQQASQADPANPQVLYYLGEASRMKGQFTEAVDNFRQAARLAGGSGDPRWQARSLQGVAESLERIEGRRDDAKSAWNEYLHFAEAHTDVANADFARARLQAIDVVAEQDNAYADVRERIAQRERENAAHPPHEHHSEEHH